MGQSPLTLGGFLMKITSIRQQERRKDRYSIYVDEKYSFSLSEAALLETRLASGQELEAAQVKSYKELSAEDKVYGNALRYAAMRRRSRWEMESYLQRKEASPDLADSILNKLSDLGFIDDQAFALAWVENRHLLRPTSKRKLQQELRAKRVSSEIIDRVLRDDQTDEREEIRAMVIRKRRQSKYQDDTKLMQYLARQGFGYQDIKAAMADDETG
jgi:regulatory protein